MTEHAREVLRAKRLTSCNRTMRTRWTSEDVKADRRYRAYLYRRIRKAHQAEEAALLLLLDDLLEDEAKEAWA